MAPLILCQGTLASNHRIQTSFLTSIWYELVVLLLNTQLLQVWRNAIPIIERLLEAKALPDIQDAESGW